MPSILKVKIIAGRNLPIMDRATELTDAFVEIYFADYEVMRTAIKRRTLNPVWNEDFRLEISDDADLQNEPLELKVLDYDQITYNDAIGSIFIDLNPLLTWDSNSQISGWLPIFDTLHGIRGELNVQVKIQFFGDMNPFKDSSAGVQFYSTNSFISKYPITNVFGLVTALDTDDDPEYHWSDNFRAPRTSNEARIRLLFRLSGKLRRILGRKVLDLGGNAVVGYQQYFDLEEETRTITARAVGCAVFMPSPTNTLLLRGASSIQFPTPTAVALPLENPTDSGEEEELVVSTTKNIVTLESGKENAISEDFLPDLAPKSPTSPNLPPTQQNVYNNKPLEVIILTPQNYPSSSIKGIGGFVTATSVKIIESDEPDVRDQWWAELRDEIRSHARTLNCGFVIGYSESMTIHEDLAILNCSGTAANLSADFLTGGAFENMEANFVKVSTVVTPQMSNITSLTSPLNISSLEGKPSDSPISIPGALVGVANTASAGSSPDDPPACTVNTTFVEKKPSMKKYNRKRFECRASHITYSRHQSPFPMSIYRCRLCKKKHVPEMLLASCEPPTELISVARPMLLEAHVCRQKKNRPGESNATSVSESLPFAQYDLHRQIMYKLRLYGLNAVFGLKMQFSVGENMLVAVATGTAVFLRSLPPPPVLKVLRNLDVVDEEDKDLLEIQRKIVQMSEQNKIRIDVEIQKSVEKEEVVVEYGSMVFQDTVGSALKSSAIASNITSSDDSSDDSDGEMLPSVMGRGTPNNPVLSSLPVGTNSGLQSTASAPPASQQKNIVIQIDDEQDEDLVLLTDNPVPDEFQIINIETWKPSGLMANSLMVDNEAAAYKTQSVTVLKRGTIGVVSHHPNRQLSKIFKEMYADLVTQFGYFQECTIAGVQYDLQLLEENNILIRMTAVAMSSTFDSPHRALQKLPSLLSTTSPQVEIGSHGLNQSLNINSQRWSLFSAMESQILEIGQSTELIGIPFGSPGNGGESVAMSATFTSPIAVSAISNFFPKARQLFRERTQITDLMGMHSSPSVSSAGSNSPILFDYDDVDEFQQQQDGTGADGTGRKSIAPGAVGSGSAGAAGDSTLYDENGRRPTIRESSVLGVSGTNNPNTYVSQSSLYSNRMKRQALLSSSHQKSSEIVEISSLSHIPNTKIDKFLGRYCMHFIKESTLSYENNTVNHGTHTFNHNFLTELYGIARSYARCLGGNALLSFKIEHSFFEQSIKNQGYALLSVSADIVQLSKKC